MKYRFWFFLLFLLFFLSACSLPFVKKQEKFVNDEEWKDEVLLAQDCGFDGLRCCDDEEKRCLYGQTCCVDPSNPKINYCADDCSCGKRGAFCCEEGDACEDGLACADNRCVPCGDLDQPCCVDGDVKTCNNDLVCYYDKCSECGLPGAPCCENDTPCIKPKEKNISARLECRNGLCAYCGAEGRVSCKSEPFCEEGNLLNNDLCLSCGNLNQPCCSTSTFSSYVCNPSENLNCNAGFCSEE